MSEYYNGICIGCLSNDRKLNEITHEDRKSMFYNFMNNTNIQSPLLLCYECKSYLNNIINFKTQVNEAQNTLQKCLNDKTRLKSLTKLKQTKVEINYFCNYHNDMINNDNDYNDNDTNDMKYKHSIYETEHSNFKLTKNDSKVVSFSSNFKFKDNDFDNNDILMNNDMILCDRKNDIKTECEIESVFVDDHDYSLENNDMIKTDDQFNQSDEEPLFKLKENKTVKEKRNREKRKSKKRKKLLEDANTRVVHNARVERKLKQLNVDPSLVQMVLLSWTEVEQQRQSALTSDYYLKSKYKCENCAVAFNHRSKLDTHMNKHQIIAGDFMCDICKIRFKSDKALYAHKRRHRIRWVCVTCGAGASRACVCADHVARAHALPRVTHTCARCGHVARSVGKLKLHMRIHSGPVSCEICGKSYKDKDTLRTHLFIHNGEKEFECNKCNKKFLFKKALEIHELSHAASQYLYCHECDVSFKNQLSYYQHMKYNSKHIDPDKMKHVCDACGARFARNASLIEHTRAKHTKETPIQCEYQNCNKRFSSRASFRSHRRVAHGPAPAHAVCPHCGLIYKSTKSLERHLRSHKQTNTHTKKLSDAQEEIK